MVLVSRSGSARSPHWAEVKFNFTGALTMSWLFAPEALDKTLFFPTVVLGLVFTFLYGYKCWRGLLKFREAMLINIFLQCGGLVAGILLMLITLGSAIN